VQEVLCAGEDSSGPLQQSQDKLFSTSAGHDRAKNLATAAAAVTTMQPFEVGGAQRSSAHKSLLRMAALVDALEAEQQLTVCAAQRRPFGRLWPSVTVHSMMMSGRTLTPPAFHARSMLLVCAGHSRSRRQPSHGIRGAPDIWHTLGPEAIPFFSGLRS